MKSKTVVVKHKAAFANTIVGKLVETVVLTAGGSIAITIGMVASQKIIDFANMPSERKKDVVDDFMSTAKRKYESKIKKN